MVKLFRDTLNILSRRQTNIFSAASIIMSAVLISRILGLLRDRLLAARFAPGELGVYYAAFRIPNMIFELLVMGALATAFIPVFTSYLETKGKGEANNMASSVMNIGLIIFIIVAIPILIFAKEFCALIAPGFNGSQILLMASFTQIMILAQVFPLILGNFLTGILESYQNFIIPSLAPVIYNVGIILGIIFLSPVIGLYAPVIGVVIGAVLFTIIQIPPVLSFGYRHNWHNFTIHKGAGEVGKLMLPRTLGLAVSQIDTTVDLVLSTLLGSAAVTIFNFAQHLQQVPIGLFGASIAQAILPSLSSNYAKKDFGEYRKIILAGFHQILFAVIPISVILIVLRIPIVRLVFGASTLFDWNSTVLTGSTLAYFSISLFAQSLVQLLARGFYALHDTKTPVIVGIYSVLTNTLLSVIFIVFMHLNVWSLAISTSIASIMQFLLLLFFLDRKIGYFDRYELFMPLIKVILAGLVTGIALYIPIKLLDQLVFDTTKTISLLALTGVATSAGLFVYFFLSWFMEVPQMGIFIKMFQKVKSMKKGTTIDTTNEVMNMQDSSV